VSEYYDTIKTRIYISLTDINNVLLTG